MIRFLLIISIVILFIGLNAGNSSDISFWFSDKAKFQNVPIYVSLFGAYILGAISVIPFALNSTINKYKKRRLNNKLDKKLKKEKIEKESKI